jgi:3-dehydroquinate synthase class II
LPLDGLSDRLCIDEVILVRLHEWLYKLSGDKPDIMALIAQRVRESEKVSPRPAKSLTEADYYPEVSD